MRRRRRSYDPDAPLGDPSAVADALAAVVARRGWDQRLRGARVHEHWQEIVGEQLARHVRPVRLHGGVLVLEAESAAWATQVRYLVGDVKRQANEVLGEGQVRQVSVTVRRGGGRPAENRG